MEEGCLDGPMGNRMTGSGMTENSMGKGGYTHLKRKVERECGRKAGGLNGFSVW
jgi:hypothetical protein